MNQSLVAVIDGTKARFFTLEPAEAPEYQSGPNLIERESLSNMANELHGKELWSSTKSGGNRGSGGSHHGYDDHRENHIEQFERGFAKEVVSTLLNLTQEHHSQNLLLIAEPQILGIVRESLTSQLPKNLKVNELAKDLCKMKTLELHEYLADKELLPARKVKTA
jgi:protein required for attachment to host cells